MHTALRSTLPAPAVSLLMILVDSWAPLDEHRAAAAVAAARGAR